MSDYQLLDKSSAACTFDAVVFKQYGGIPWRNVTDQPGCCTTQHIRDNTSGDVVIGQSAIGLDTSSCNVTLYSDKFYTLTFSKGAPSRSGLTEQDCGQLEINASHVPHSFDASTFSFNFGSISQYLNFTCDDRAAASSISSKSVSLFSATSTTIETPSATVTSLSTFSTRAAVTATSISSSNAIPHPQSPRYGTLVLVSMLLSTMVASLG